MIMAVEPLQLVHLVLDFLDPGIHLALEYLGLEYLGLCFQLVNLTLGGHLRLFLGVPVALRLTIQPRELFLELPDALTTLTIML